MWELGNSLSEKSSVPTNSNNFSWTCVDFLQYDKFCLARSVSRALLEVIGGLGGCVVVEGAGGRDLQFGIADLLAALLETRANVLDALGELGQRRQDVVLGNL